jgi:hypothetical protein
MLFSVQISNGVNPLLFSAKAEEKVEPAGRIY